MGVTFDPVLGMLRTKDASSGGGGQITFTKVVAPSGGDYTTLSAAIAAASNGWKIRVMPGTYTEAGFSTALTSLTIEGLNRNDVILNFSTNNVDFTGANTVVRGIQMNFTTGTLSTSGSNQIFDNIYWSKSGASNHGWLLSGSHTIVKSSQLVWTVSAASSQIGFNCNGAEYLLLGNYFSFNNTNNTANSGTIRLVGSTNTGRAIGNHFELTAGNNNNFVICDGASTGGANLIMGNTFDDTISTTTSPLLFVRGSLQKVIGNNFRNCSAGVAIKLHTDCTRSTFTNNNTADSKNGIVVPSSAGFNVITSNSFEGHSTAAGNGIDVTSNRNIISNNFAEGFNIGIIIQAGATNNVVTSNLANGNSTQLTDSGTTTSTNNNVTT